MFPELLGDGAVSNATRVKGSRVTLELSQTFLECSAYCSTTGRMLVVTIRWARLKLWSISLGIVSMYLVSVRGGVGGRIPWRVKVMDCSSFSSSSVSVRLRWEEVLARDIDAI